MKIFLTILFVISFVVSNAQYAEELEQKEKDVWAIKDPVEKSKILIELCNDYHLFDSKKSYWYAQKAYQFAFENNYDDKIAECLFLLGRACYAVSLHDSSLVCYQKGLQLFREMESNKGIGNCLMGMGEVYYFRDEYDISEDYYVQALSYFKKENDQIGLANIYISLGDVNNAIDDYPEASVYYQNAYDIYEKENSILGKGTALNCMADINFEQKLFDDARQNYEKAIAYLTEVQDILGISNCTKRIGDIYFEREIYDTAYIYFNKAKASYEKINSHLGVANTLSSMGRIHMIAGRYNAARSNYNKSLQFFIEKQDKMGIANAHALIGRLDFALKDYKNALSNTLKAYEISKEIKSVEISMFTSEMIAKCYAALGLFEDAYKYKLINDQLGDSLNSEENIRKITQLQLQFQFDQQKKERELIQVKKELEQEEKLDRQKVYTLMGLSGVIITLISTLFYYKNYKNKEVASKLLEEKNEIIQNRNKDITDSLEYAKVLQKAILPQKSILYEVFTDAFIFYKPRDIVSGDFHWCSKINNTLHVIAADCTGHGVPGAFMSLLGNEFAHQVISNPSDTPQSPIEVLKELDSKIKDSLHIYEDQINTKDGMDLCYAMINLDTLKLKYSGANNPLLIIRDKQLTILNPNKTSVGAIKDYDSLFEEEFLLQKGDCLYLFSDGYQDQFGGEHLKKFMKKRFYDFLVEISPLSMNEQKAKLKENILDWMGSNKQVDDMLVIGIKV
jgi:serine phosphatase RsbU (regulator of sigma subunit)